MSPLIPHSCQLDHGLQVLVGSDHPPSSAVLDTGYCLSHASYVADLQHVDAHDQCQAAAGAAWLSLIGHFLSCIDMMHKCNVQS